MDTELLCVITQFCQLVMKRQIASCCLPHMNFQGHCLTLLPLAKSFMYVQVHGVCLYLHDEGCHVSCSVTFHLSPFETGWFLELDRKTVSPRNSLILHGFGIKKSVYNLTQGRHNSLILTQL